MKFNTRYKIQNTRYKLKAQSLLEALLSIALGVILIGGSVGLIGVSLRIFNTAKQHLQANSLMRQTAEIIQSLTRDNWHNIYDLYPGIHYKLAKQGNAYAIQKGEEKIFDSQGLVSYWSFDEATSTIAYDSQSTNNGTLYNGPTWQSPSSCVSGSCLSFNGSNNYVTMGDWLTAINAAGKITFEFWEKSTSTADQTVWSTNSLTSANSLLVSLQNLQYWDNNAVHHGVSANSNFSDGNFHYFVAIVDTIANTYSYYEDGVLLGSGSIAAGSSILNSSDMSLGRRSGGGYYTNAILDEVRIYNRALSADEIRAHYQAGLDKLGLVSYWALDENGGTIAYDNQSTNNGTLTNGPTWQPPSNCVSGSCLSFDGSNDYVNVGTDSSLYPANITIEAWAKANDPLPQWEGIISNMTSWGTGFSLQMGTVENIAAMVSGVYLTTSWVPSPGVWYHIVATHDSTTNLNILYVNGKEENRMIRAVSYETNPKTYIGVFYTSPSLYFNGLIDEPRIYNRALTAEEISQRYQASYTKYFVTNKISRTSGNIDTTYNSANDDPSTLKINSVVKYGRGLVSQQTGGINDLRFYLTRSYNNQTFWQTDWSGGSGQTGPISNPGNKFDTADSNINYASTTGSIYMTTATTTAASLTSSILDTGVSGGAGFNSLLWQGSLGTGGVVQFQIAFSNSSSTVNTFYGPTSTSDYYQPNPNVSIVFPTTGTASPQNNRYLRYKVYLSTSSTTPQVNDIIINWTP